MDKRTVLALVLVALVVIITPALFPTARPTPPQPERNAPSAPAQTDSAVATDTAPAPDTMSLSTSERIPAAAPIRAESIMVADSLMEAVFSGAGASMVRVELLRYRALDQRNGHVTLTAGSTPLLSYRLMSQGDTISLGDHILAVERSGTRTRFSGLAGGQDVEITYDVIPDSFLTRVSGRVHVTTGHAPASYLLIDLPQSLMSFEADSNADYGSLAYAVKPGERSAEGIPFRSLDPGEREIVPGPITWTVAKNKYFMVGLLAPEGTDQLIEAQITGGPRVSSTPTLARGTVVARLGADGAFGFDVYTGPQQYQRLRSLGRDFENSNPYGGWMQSVVQPFATIVMRILLWMKATLGWSYGWLLVLFGVAVRLILWPLNQGAMRSSIRMQRIQPELNAIQQKHKGDPQRLQAEMMRVYKEHGMSPFSAFSGCLPLLIPMPVLFALFFVFQNTIEFRGVPFLWLTDISLKDPYYIIPLFMGLSMFALSWIGLRNSPPNPQAKMLAYVMPVMMTVLFANFASGLNLYYAVQNIAALPQQWLIANERARSNPRK
jgi:YidC/Oxa1 family membrane protein insertase